MNLTKKRTVVFSAFVLVAVGLLLTQHFGSFFEGGELTLESKGEPKRLLLLDFNDPFEIDTWVRLLGLQTENCPAGYHYCNREFLAWRPLRVPQSGNGNGDLSARGQLIEWLKDNQIEPEGIFISGHHVGGFMGTNGTLYVHDLKPLLENNNGFFIKPKIVYLGGCYTVQSQFFQNEQDRISYLNRILTHDGERPRAELIIAALHQIASGNDPNLWAKVFPNAALFGYKAIGPGEKSKPYFEKLAEQFAVEVVRVTNERNFSRAYFTILDNINEDETAAVSDNLQQAVKWWNVTGPQYGPCASGFCVKEKKQASLKPTLSESKSQDRESYKVLRDFFVTVVANDRAQNPWLGSLDETQRWQIIDDLLRIFRRMDLPEDIELERAFVKVAVSSKELRLNTLSFIKIESLVKDKLNGGQGLYHDIMRLVEAEQAKQLIEAEIARRQAGPRKLKEFQKMEFVKISPGTFIMGSPESEKYRKVDEKQHQVHISQAFEMQATEVTQYQWFRVMGNNPSAFKNQEHCPKTFTRLKNERGEEIFLCPNHPVEKVSWDDINNPGGFLDKLNAVSQGQYHYRLPTEAEWEMAVRAGSSTAYYWGQEESVSWLFGIVESEQTAQVGTRVANGFGLYDISGNVQEWVVDWYSDDYHKLQPVDPQNLEKSSCRVVRGGGWDDGASGLRSAYRIYDVPSNSYSDVGLRLVRTKK